MSTSLPFVHEDSFVVKRGGDSSLRTESGLRPFLEVIYVVKRRFPVFEVINE